MSRHLQPGGFNIRECADGRATLECVTKIPYDLILLDAALPTIDSIALCRAIRHGLGNPHAGIIVIASSAVESDKVLSLVNGADDYVARSVGAREFRARVAAVMRRIRRAVDQSLLAPIDRGDLRLDPSRRQASVRGSVISCSKQEFELLYALATSPGIVFSRDELLTQYWPKRRRPDVRVIDSFVSRLRRRIERDPTSPQMLVTVRGIGYKFRSSR